MREQLKALSKETLIYGLSTVVGRFLNFLLVPFYVNVLRSTAEYGMATSLYTYIGFLNVIYPLGLEAAFFRYGARGEGELYQPEKENKLFSTPFLFIFLVGGCLTAGLYVLAPHLVYPVFHDSKIDISPMIPMLCQILRLGAFILFFDGLTVLPFAVLRLEHQAWEFAGIRLTGILVTLILNFVFVMGKGWGVRGIFIANLLASILVFLMLLPTIGKRMAFKIDWDVVRKLLPFGLTNVPAYLSSMMVQVIDRPIVQAYLGLGVLGIYQANYRMGFIMMVIVSLFEYAWRPFFMRQFLKNDQEARLIFSRVFTYFMLLALFAFLALSWGLPPLVSTLFWGHRLLKTPYLVGLPIIPVVLLAYVFQGMYTNFIAGIYIREKNKVLPFVTTLGAAVNIFSNMWLIPLMGIMGAALATLFAYMAMAGAIYVQSQKAYPVPYEWPRVLRLCMIVGGVYGLERLLTLGQFLTQEWNLLAIRGILFVAAVGCLFIFNFFSVREKQILHQIIFRNPA